MGDITKSNFDIEAMKCVLLLAAAMTVATVQGDVVNQSIKRTFDLTKHVVRELTEYQFSNADAKVLTYDVAFPRTIETHMAYVAARCGKIPCEIVPATSKHAAKARTPEDVALYSVLLKKPLEKGEIGTVKVTAYFTRVLTPYPAEITQTEDQLVLFENYFFVFSPYATKTQTTKLKLPLGKVEKISAAEPISRKGSIVTLGPYTDVKSFGAGVDSSAMSVHYKNHAPFMTITKLVREIEVSMWGRVSFEEVYDLEHTGARLKGGFSRLDYVQSQQRGASFYEMNAHLPKDSVNVYYRDQIGNISTSRLRPASRSGSYQELEFKPRFPMFGGWKSQWYLGYSVPTYSVLTHVDNKFKLKVDFSTPVQGASVDDLTVKVILPEGATNVRATVPFGLDSQSKTTRQTYLDTPVIGRPVLILEKKNVVAAHNVPFEITFDFPKHFMMHEPILLVSAFLSFFAICMLLFRLDISIAKKPTMKKKTE
ncbi:putative ribophorin I [Plasmopara halstedii]